MLHKQHGKGPPMVFIFACFFDVFHLFLCLTAPVKSPAADHKMVFNGVNKGAKSAKGCFLVPFLDRNPGETITKEGFTPME
jgi:hypothetical protein